MRHIARANKVLIALQFQGKGLFATKQFNGGDVILAEDPLVSCQFAWNAAYRYLACDHCMRYLTFFLYTYLIYYIYIFYSI